MSLPKPSVKYATAGPDSLDPKSLKGILCNPIYTGVAPYPSMINDEEWVKTALKEIEKDGAEQFLVNMLYVLRKSMLAITSDVN